MSNKLKLVQKYTAIRVCATCSLSLLRFLRASGDLGEDHVRFVRGGSQVGVKWGCRHRGDKCKVGMK